MSSDRFEPLVESLERFVENTRQLGIIVSDFPQQGQLTLNQKLHSLVAGLQELEKCKSCLQDAQVPLELISQYVDQGRNPQLYTKDCMERAVIKNEHVKGKIEAFKKFKSALINELSNVFPEETQKYKALKSRESNT
ncbi:putative mediator of RNA polymerase II transcription subunit 10 [Apostichopus japonicus]|uniref:Mediator of RNA polymerase II transcription subunit 10 n=1 Tax=Stichopus japonicus TaxID=307972 RepID=A0A2G8LCU4_STIJA|nr:putative mediator of RNA polymerase II transcription subunit 10 [Apostichopus japonicus]